MDPQAIESQLRDFLAARVEEEGIAAAYLFGSVARGTARPESDVDVGILYSEEPPTEEHRLQSQIEKSLGIRAQVVVLNQVPPELAVRIFSEGDRFIERDRRKMVQFEVDTRNEYWDLERYLDMYRKTNGLPLRPSLEDLLEEYRESRQ
ncbi:MAG TPA: nucleotidyltransferase domain-containing protein [Thermoanaerobaculia bacterium]|nr:nucleotidyltransferase domain-containing protein [Thermoanaerobaculia bacterium]